tara:strand:- start:115 stop:501 length:387 start_codon:yes stop_codon:yes gene_type:complete
MNFLAAFQKNTDDEPFQKRDKTPDKLQEIKIDSVDEMYHKNVKNSVITYYLPELQDMCEDFVNESLYLDYPILKKHHQGYKNFFVEMGNLYENFTDVMITEKVEKHDESDVELDPSDITDTRNIHNTF